MPPTVLILTAGFGEGHNAAARAVGAAWEERHGPSTAPVVDLCAAASPWLNAWGRRGYLGAINRFPRFWRRAYGWMDRSSALPRSLPYLMRDELRILERRLADQRPAAVCSSYPAYAFLIERLRRDGRFTGRHYNIVTDSISINSLWWSAGADGWFLPNEDTAEAMRGAGLAPDKLHVTGFPVNLFFCRHAGEFMPPEPGPGVAPRILYIVHSGTHRAEATAELLLAQADWDVTFAVGRDEALRQRLERRAAGRRRPARILGWTDTVPELLMTHHLVISKAGGATTQEAIAARCPMIVNQVVPGQEEGNYELLRRHNAGILARTPEAILAAARDAMADDGAGWRSWRRNLAELSRPDAARRIVHHLCPAGVPAACP